MTFHVSIGDGAGACRSPSGRGCGACEESSWGPRSLAAARCFARDFGALRAAFRGCDMRLNSLSHSMLQLDGAGPSIVCAPHPGELRGSACAGGDDEGHSRDAARPSESGSPPLAGATEGHSRDAARPSESGSAPLTGATEGHSRDAARPSESGCTPLTASLSEDAFLALLSPLLRPFLAPPSLSTVAPVPLQLAASQTLRAPQAVVPGQQQRFLPSPPAAEGIVDTPPRAPAAVETAAPPMQDLKHAPPSQVGCYYVVIRSFVSLAASLCTLSHAPAGRDAVPGRHR